MAELPGDSQRLSFRVIEALSQSSSREEVVEDQATHTALARRLAVVQRSFNFLMVIASGVQEY